MVGGIGGFAGLFDASALARYRRPLLATSTDGVGTKVVIAQRLGRYDTVGIDLVAMVVDDLVACGAEPLFLTDYVVFGRLRPERAAAVVAGVAEGCVRAGCALLGGETAEHPGHLGPDDFDLAGAATGVVEADAVLGPDRVRAGDVVLGLASSGLHANGYSLVRRVIDGSGLDAGRRAAGTGPAAGGGTAHPDRHLRPGLPGAGGRLRGARAGAHHRRRAGGEPGPGGAARPGRGAGPRQLAATAGVRPAGGPRRDRAPEMERVFNMGVGMVAVVAASDADRALRLLSGRGTGAWVLGQITADGNGVRLAGIHP